MIPRNVRDCFESKLWFRQTVVTIPFISLKIHHTTVKQRSMSLYGKRNREVDTTSGGADSVPPLTVEEEKFWPSWGLRHWKG